MRRDGVFSLTLLVGTLAQVCSQLCGGPCKCPSPVPRCPTGVPLVLDGCRCCRVCARQRGEACDDKYVCDAQRGLQCDYSASFPGGPGECVSQDELGCELNGITYHEGQVFQPSCAVQCRCAGGGVTCVPLCSEDVRLPGPDCPEPQRVLLPGKCCKEWVCENSENSVSYDALSGHGSDGARPNLPGRGRVSGCVEQSTKWSACSHTCGPGVSTRVSNRNPACRLELESRQCQVRPCRAFPPSIPTRSSHCEPSYRLPFPMRLRHQGCRSLRSFRPQYCGLCSDGRCCTPHRTRTLNVTFRCPHGRLLRRAVMAIDSCVCHHRCPRSFGPALRS